MSSKKLKTIVIATITYKNLTGVELYVYELSRELARSKKRVIVLAPEVGGEIVERTISNGVEVYDFQNCPDDIQPDILHVNEQLPTMFALSRWPDVPVVTTIHSQFAVEKPFISSRISAYICIREEVRQKVIHDYGIPEDKVRLIYNGFDFERFRYHGKKANNHKNTILFVGTIDPLRRKSIEHLIEDTKAKNQKLIVAGKKYDTYLDKTPPHVTVLSPQWNIENLLHRSEILATAGVLLGRTTIEGWISGKPGIIYDINLDGSIKSVDTFMPPADIDKFNIVNVVKEITNTYNEAIKQDIIDRDAINNRDMSRMVSELISRSTTQGMVMHELVKRTEGHETRISSLETGSTSLHGRIHSLEQRYIVGAPQRWIRNVTRRILMQSKSKNRK